MWEDMQAESTPQSIVLFFVNIDKRNVFVKGSSRTCLST